MRKRNAHDNGRGVMASHKRKARILVADDNPECLRMLARIAARQCEVLALATDGITALELIRRVRPEIVVLDFDMPGRTGIDILNELATDAQRPAAVICSVDTSAELISAARNAGALAFVAKQYSARDLLPALDAVYQQRPFFPPCYCSVPNGSHGGRATRLQTRRADTFTTHS